MSRSLQLFSSISALFGNQGQANYAAANSVLDAMAARLRHVGQSGCSIQWGPWAMAGMANKAPELLAKLQRQGG